MNKKVGFISPKIETMKKNENCRIKKYSLSEIKKKSSGKFNRRMEMTGNIVNFRLINLNIYQQKSQYLNNRDKLY